jgi:hypothetical protein
MADLPSQPTVRPSDNVFAADQPGIFDQALGRQLRMLDEVSGMSRRSFGRGKPSACVVRIRSVLRCMVPPPIAGYSLMLSRWSCGTAHKLTPQSAASPRTSWTMYEGLM